MFHFISNNPPHLNNKIISYSTLVNSIEQLEIDNVITFDEFEKTPLHIIRKFYFKMPNPTMMRKAIIYIRNKRDGNTGPNEIVTTTQFIEKGQVTKVQIKTERYYLNIDEVESF
ncbi:MAG: hypothetical protein IPK03_03400 [Bacteroidetes bacterium]|nr:hypothetical protein [Bacteroidota bacterium]